MNLKQDTVTYSFGRLDFVSGHNVDEEVELVILGYSLRHVVFLKHIKKLATK